SLNQPFVLADVGVKNYMKGIARHASGDKTIDRSSFIKSRRTQARSAYETKGQRAAEALGAPLRVAEMGFIELAWNAQYEQALANGFKGQEAVLEADRKAERAVAGRGVADRPELYRST